MIPNLAQVNENQAPAVHGMLASSNPRQWALAGRAAFTVAPTGLASQYGIPVGVFVWAGREATDEVTPDGSPRWVRNKLGSVGTQKPLGIVAREGQATFGFNNDVSGNFIPPGRAIEVLVAGDLWVRSDFLPRAEPGLKVYASNTDGRVAFFPVSSVQSGFQETSYWAHSSAGQYELAMISTQDPRA